MRKVVRADVHCERKKVISAPPDEVWAWMTKSQRLPLFTVNVFHTKATTESKRLEVGSRIQIEHSFLFFKEKRVARISHFTPFEIRWSESKEGSKDWFPHSQRLRLEIEGNSCVIHNRLDGAFTLPGAKWWLVWWYRWILALILDAENRKIARLTIASD